MLPITTSRKIDCIRQIEETITVPAKNYFVKNETSLRLCYVLRGNQIKYINLPSPEDVEIFLKKHGIIKYSSFRSGKITMYEIGIVTITGPKGEPVQYERKFEYRWEDIDFTPANVAHFAAVHEFELSGNSLGFNIKKVLGKKGYKQAS